MLQTKDDEIFEGPLNPVSSAELKASLAAKGVPSSKKEPSGPSGLIASALEDNPFLTRKQALDEMEAHGFL